MDAAGVRALADLPGREQLLAVLAGTMSAPATKLVRTLNEVPTQFVRALAAVRDAKAAEGGAGGAKAEGGEGGEGGAGAGEAGAGGATN